MIPGFMIQQRCPYPGCEETLTFEVITHGVVTSGEYSIQAQTTPESTAHAYSHQEESK